MDKNKLIESASKLIAKGALDKAVKEYQRVLDVDPDDVRVLQKLAELYQKMQRREEAADCFEKVARTYAAQGFYLKAVALYKQVLKVVDRIEVNVRLAELYQQLGLVGDATKEWQNVAAYYEKVGDLKASLDTLRKLVDLDPDNVAARIRLGEQYARQDQTVEAVTELRRAASYLQRNGRQDDYMRVAERISHLDPGDAQLAKELAESYLARGDSKRALAKLQICFKANPRDLATLQMLARAFQELGQVSKTVSVLKELARVHADAGRAEEAKRTYGHALELAPDDTELKASLRALEVAAQPARPPTAPIAAPRPPTAPIAQPRPPAGPIQTGVTRPAAGPIAPRPPTGPIAKPPSGPIVTPRPLESTPVAPASVPKLLKETEVYVKYGLHEKALEHLRKIFSVEPENAEAHEKAKALALAMNRPADAASSLAMLVKLYTARSDPRAEGARAELRALDPDSAALQSGPAHAASGAASTAASAAVVASAEEDEYEPVEVGEYVEGELDEAIVEDTDVVFADDELSGEIETDPLDSGPDAGQAGAPGGEDAFASDLAEAEFYMQAGLTEDARAIIEAILLAEPGHAEAQRRLSALSGPIEAAPLPKRMAAAKRSAGASGDLAAELAAELASEGMALVVAEDEGPIEPESLASFQVPVHEVLGEFRAKLQETVRPEDVQTHYDLGIAYKEMGLIDEAVAEFEVALRHGGGVRKADSVTMLGLCAREKGDLEGAAQWFRTGLDEADLSPPARRALAFELAEIYEALGQQAMALEQYQIVERVEPGFRDVAQRIVHLGGSVSTPQKNGARPPSPKRDASAPPPVAVAPPASVSPVSAAASLARPAGAGRAAAASAATQPAKAARPADHEPEPQANETQAQRRNRKIGFV